MNVTPTLEMLDQATLTVDINVRKEAALTADFIDSIKEHGVMEPVIAHRKEHGVVHLLMGQRRTRVAVEAERPLIPVLIIDSPEEAERIVTQVVENIQRAELTEADEADAYHQLSLIGVSAAAIAEKTGRTKASRPSCRAAPRRVQRRPEPACCFFCRISCPLRTHVRFLIRAARGLGPKFGNRGPTPCNRNAARSIGTFPWNTRRSRKIGILGAGNIGTTLANRLAEAGHQVKVANLRGLETIPEMR